MTLSIIVAAAENGIIGHHNQLIWHLPADLRRFKQLTTGHTVIMGRRTHQSIGRPLPNRRNIVISRDPAFQAPGCLVARDIDQALALAADDTEAFIIGGGAIYRALWHRADRLLLTLVHDRPEGDTAIPPVLPEEWRETSREPHPADDKNPLPYTFINYTRP